MTQERPQAGLEFGETERLDQVIVGPGVQAAHAVVHAIRARNGKHLTIGRLLNQGTP